MIKNHGHLNLVEIQSWVCLNLACSIRVLQGIIELGFDLVFERIGLIKVCKIYGLDEN